MSVNIDGVGNNQGLDTHVNKNNSSDFELWKDINDQMNQLFDGSDETNKETYSIVEKPAEIIAKHNAKLKEAYSKDPAYLSRIAFEN